MTPPTLVSVLNQSKISDAVVEAMTRVVGKQLARDVAPFYGKVPAVEFVRAGGTPSPGGCPCWIQNTPDVEGALGYHDEDEHGVPYIKCFAITGQTTVGPEALSVTLSHEILELTGDPDANLWADGPGGLDYARELCDAVEGDVYTLDGVSVSNFVLPAFFAPRAQAGSRFDYMSKLTRPFAMTAGGYQIVRTEPGEVSQSFAARAARLGAHEARQAAPRVHVLFRENFPTARRASKVARAAARRGRPRT